jgi:hypothetical protein
MHDRHFGYNQKFIKNTLFGPQYQHQAGRKSGAWHDPVPLIRIALIRILVLQISVLCINAIQVNAVAQLPFIKAKY